MFLGQEVHSFMTRTRPYLGDQGDLADNLDDLGDNIAQGDYIGRGHLCDLGYDQHQTARWQLS